MKLYRYIISDGRNIGILVYLDQVFDPNTDDGLDMIWKLCHPFEDFLKKPNIDGWPCSRFWFTEKGNRKFNKAIRKIRKEYSSMGIETQRLEMDIDSDSEEIVYRDEYQVAIRRYKRQYFID